MFDRPQALADTWEIAGEELARIRVPYTLPEDQMTGAIELLARAWHSITGAEPRHSG